MAYNLNEVLNSNARKRSRKSQQLLSRPCLDFEKMQQVNNKTKYSQFHKTVLKSSLEVQGFMKWAIQEYY